MNTMNIATALNRKYVPYTAVMLKSLCLNHADKTITAYLLHSELQEEDMAFLREELGRHTIRLVFLQADLGEYRQKIPTNTQWTIETCYRLLLLDLLPADVERLLYIDVDIIINKPLTALYDMDFEGNELIATYNFSGERSQETYTDKQKEMFGPMFEAGYRYFCAGFVLFNISELRKHYNFNSYVQAMEEWNWEMYAPDQDILNYVHWKKVGYADCLKYGLFARVASQKGVTCQEMRDYAASIHYVGNKPWEAKLFHFDAELIWWEYAKETSIYHELLESFLYESMTDQTMKTTYEQTWQTNLWLCDELENQMQQNKKLLAQLQGGGNEG